MTPHEVEEQRRLRRERLARRREQEAAPSTLDQAGAQWAGRVLAAERRQREKLERLAATAELQRQAEIAREAREAAQREERLRALDALVVTCPKCKLPTLLLSLPRRRGEPGMKIGRDYVKVHSCFRHLYNNRLAKGPGAAPTTPPGPRPGTRADPGALPMMPHPARRSA